MSAMAFTMLPFLLLYVIDRWLPTMIASIAHGESDAALWEQHKELL